MKIRTDYVTNSSSSSYIVTLKLSKAKLPITTKESLRKMFEKNYGKETLDESSEEYVPWIADKFKELEAKLDGETVVMLASIGTEDTEGDFKDFIKKLGGKLENLDE